MQSELRVQQECFVWFNNTYPELRGLLFKVRNEGHNKISGAIDKATGLVPGVSDMILLLNKTAYLLEFKTEKGRQSDAQKSWMFKVTLEGYDYIIIRSLEQFKGLICQLLEY